MKPLIFLLGGARSGKSAFALEESSRIHGKKAFIATAQSFDEEMEFRIEKHKTERGPDWVTFEEPLNIAETIGEIDSSFNAVIVDCLTLWTSNVMHSDRDFSKEVDKLVERLSSNRPAPIYIISNEVGLGLVPENPLGRAYRDNLGLLNRKMAGISTEVYFMTAGIPLKIKEM